MEVKNAIPMATMGGSQGGASIPAVAKNTLGPRDGTGRETGARAGLSGNGALGANRG